LNKETLELREGLGLAEELDGGVGLGDGSEELEEAAEAAHAQERELGAGVSEPRFQRKRHLPVHSLPVQRVHQLLHRRSRRSLLCLGLRRRLRRCHSLRPQRLLQVHFYLSLSLSV
jgi:hypothetical protein